MSNYIGPDNSRQKDTQNRVAYTASAAQTNFGARYTVGYVDVYKNGLKLKGSGIEFTALNGTNIVLTSGATAGDYVEIISSLTSSPYNFYTKPQVDNKVGIYYGTASGTGDAMTVLLTPVPSALTDGLEIRVRVPGTNTITNPTITLMGLGVAKGIFSSGGKNITIGAFGANQEITLRYNITLDRFELISGVILHGATAPQFDNSTALVNSTFLQRALGNVAGSVNLSGNTTLSATHTGKLINLQSGATAITLPNATTYVAGTKFIFKDTGATTSVISPGTVGQLIGKDAAITSVTLGLGDSLELTNVAQTSWVITGGSASFPYTLVFGASLSNNGYQRLPSGLIMQWGRTGAVGSNAGVDVTFPITFPTAFLHAGVTANTDTDSNDSNAAFRSATVSGMRVLQTTTDGCDSLHWFAIGY